MHMHHMFYWKGRHGYQLDELATVCEKCHTPANHQKGGKLFGFGEGKEFADLSGAAFMNAVRWQIVDALYTTYDKEFVTITYGAMAKEKRIALQLEKTHNNDAYAMGDYHPACRCKFRHYQKPLILTLAPATRQKEKNSLMAELTVITKKILRICTSTAAKRYRRAVAL